MLLTCLAYSMNTIDYSIGHAQLVFMFNKHLAILHVQKVCKLVSKLPSNVVCPKNCGHFPDSGTL